MNKHDILKAVSMPIYSPSFKKGPHVFRDREFMIISYETDLEALKQALAPISKLPVKKVLGALHFVSDLTLGKGKVEYDYLA